MTTRVLLTDSDLGPPLIEQATCDAAGCELVEAACRTEEDVMAAIDEYSPSGLLVQYAPITERVLVRARCVRAVSRYGVGLDCVDIDAARRLGVEVFNVPDYSVSEVADHAMTLALMLIRQFAWWTAGTRLGSWPIAKSSPRPLLSFDAMTFALVGFGRIARAVGARARAFGARVIAHDPFVTDAEISRAGAQPVSIDDLWQVSDLVSLHAPLTEETRHLVNDDVLGQLRCGAYLVNTARAELVDRVALQVALSRNTLGGLGADVWWDEPPRDGDPLLADPRVIVTPHIAYLSTASLPRLRQRAIQQLVERLLR